MIKIDYIIISLIFLIVVVCYIKKILLYVPTEANVIKYEIFFSRIKKLICNDEYIISRMIDTDDSVLLDTLYLKNPDSDICVIYFHGNAGNISMRFEMIRFLYNHASVLIYDYRGYGRSSGSIYTLSERTMLDDSKNIWKYCVNVLSYAPDKISLFGESLGCSISLCLCADLSRETYDNRYPHSVVLNAPFYSLESMIQIILNKAKLGFISGFLSKILSGEYYSNSFIKYIHPNTKVLVAHSQYDEIIPYLEGIKLYKTITSTHPHTQFINISGSHNNLYLTDSYIYALSFLYE